jgi:hypothetical protein
LKNVFEHPDENITIHGYTVEWEANNFCENSFDKFEIFLNDLDLKLDFDDVNCKIIKKNF